MKKIPKLLWVVLATSVGPFVPGAAVAVYNTIYSKDVDGVDKMSALVWGAFLEWAKTYVPQHWDRLLWVSAGIMIVIGLLGPGRYRIVNAWKQRLLVKRVGLRAYLPRRTNEERRESWGDCVSFLSDSRNSTIRLVAANGWETFGNATSPLYGVIKNFHGNIRILLVYPYSDAIGIRASSLNQEVGEYRGELIRTLAFCQTLKRQGSDIEVRLFDWPPVWKMIFSNDRLWLQHYETGTHVDDTPAYSFGREPYPSSLYHPFSAEFARMWERSEGVNLMLPTDVIVKVLEERPRPLMCSNCDGRPAGIRPAP